MADEAANDKAENDDEEVKEKQPMSTMKIVIIAVVLASVLSGGVVGLTMFLMSDDSGDAVAETKADAADEAADEAEEEEDEAEAEEEESEGPPIYHRMDPKFVVSFRDQRNARFMQFSVQIMTRDKKVIDQIKEHNPAIRSNLLLLFDGKSSDMMSSREGKEELLREITDDINASLENLADISGVEAAYFESFLIQ